MMYVAAFSPVILLIPLQFNKEISELEALVESKIYREVRDILDSMAVYDLKLINRMN